MVVDLAKDAAETSLTQIDAVKYLASHHVFSQDLPSVSRKNSQALHLSAWSPIVPRGRLAKKNEKSVRRPPHWVDDHFLEAAVPA